jgi:hypothetical protein
MSEANKELSTIASELKGIRNILASMWHSRYSNGETDQVSPEIYAEEYISTEECAKRLGVTDQTIRNWILQGKKKQVDPRFKGWIQGVHYIVIPVGTKKEMVRIPWNQLILSYSKGPEASLRTFDNDRGTNLYENKRDFFENLQKEKG